MDSIKVQGTFRSTMQPTDTRTRAQFQYKNTQPAYSKARASLVPLAESLPRLLDTSKAFDKTLSGPLPPRRDEVIMATNHTVHLHVSEQRAIVTSLRALEQEAMQGIEGYDRY